MPSQDIRLLLYPVISSCGDQVSNSYKHVSIFFLNHDLRELNSPKEELTLAILC